MSIHSPLLRQRIGHAHHRVTYVELFFDLVFVFAVTQISHAQLAHFTPLGMLQIALLFLAVWWVWIFTSWSTNWLDPERTPVRLMLFLMMAGGLFVSMSLPKAFGDRGLVFGLAFAAMQVGRSTFLFAAVPPHTKGLKDNALRILIWMLASSVFWIAGGFAEGNQRLMLWAVAVAIEYLAPLMRFAVPGLGASSFDDWDVEGGHMSERCALFIIIALGESLLITGATFAELNWSAGTVAAFVFSFVASVAMWWIYFHRGAEAGAHKIAGAQDSGRIARLAYTYLHIPIVAGIILCAVGDELVLAHPSGHMEPKTLISVVGGPLLFLGGTVAFKAAIRGFFQLSHLAGIAILIGLAIFGSHLEPVTLSAATSLVLVVVAVWEARSLRDDHSEAST